MLSPNPTSPINAIPTTIPTTAPQVPHTGNTHPMITRSKDGVFKPKALTAMTEAIPLVPTAAPLASCTPNANTVQCTKSEKINSTPKLDYNVTKPSSYKIAAQYPQWCSAMNDEFATLQRQGT